MKRLAIVVLAVIGASATLAAWSAPEIDNRVYRYKGHTVMSDGPASEEGTQRVITRLEVLPLKTGQFFMFASFQTATVGEDQPPMYVVTRTGAESSAGPFTPGFLLGPLEGFPRLERDNLRPDSRWRETVSGLMLASSPVELEYRVGDLERVAGRDVRLVVGTPTEKLQDSPIASLTRVERRLWVDPKTAEIIKATSVVAFKFGSGEQATNGTISTELTLDIVESLDVKTLAKRQQEAEMYLGLQSELVGVLTAEDRGKQLKRVQRSLKRYKRKHKRGAYIVGIGQIEQGLETIRQLASSGGPRSKNKLVGKAAPAIELQDLEGKTVKLQDYRGKVILLNFFASW